MTAKEIDEMAKELATALVDLGKANPNRLMVKPAGRPAMDIYSLAADAVKEAFSKIMKGAVA